MWGRLAQDCQTTASEEDGQIPDKSYDLCSLPNNCDSRSVLSFVLVGRYRVDPLALPFRACGASQIVVRPKQSELVLAAMATDQVSHLPYRAFEADHDRPGDDTVPDIQLVHFIDGRNG